MATGTGLDSQVVIGLESTWGTAVTPAKAIEFDSESIAWEPSWIEPSGLRVGTKFKRASRLTQSRQTVGGDISLQFASRNMGTLLKAMLGSTVVTPTVVAGSAYKQVHVPGDYLTKSLTVQVGRPEPGGTVRPHTYAGMKVTDWEFSVSDGENSTLSVTFDGRSESTATALVVPSYLSAEVFDFSDVVTFKLGGTASTASGEISVSGGTTVPAVVRSFTLRGTTPLANERYGLGNAGLKSEQLENDIPTITGSLEAEWDRTTFYDAYKANTTTALEFKQEGAIISGSDKNTNHIVLPAIKFKNSPFNVGGPDIVSGSLDFEVYSDEVNAAMMWKLISADSTAI